MSTSVVKANIVPTIYIVIANSFPQGFLHCTMLAMLSNFRAALFSSVEQFIATLACVMAYTLVALHICYWMLYGFFMDLFWNAEGPPMFALALYYFLDHWFRPGKRPIEPSRASSGATMRTLSRWQAARILLLVWAVPDSVATVLGEWPNLEILFDDPLMQYVDQRAD